MPHTLSSVVNVCVFTFTMKDKLFRSSSIHQETFDRPTRHTLNNHIQWLRLERIYILPQSLDFCLIIIACSVENIFIAKNLRRLF